MPDPTDDRLRALQGLDDAGLLPALPPEEVRRLGDRRRRRRTTAISLSVVAAFAGVVAVGGTVVANLPAPGDPPGEIADSGSGLTRIPGSFDVTLGMPPNQSGRPVIQERGGDFTSLLEFCGESRSTSDGRLESLVATTSGRDYRDIHEVVLYADGTAARSVYESVTTSARECPVEELPEANGSVATRVSDWEVSDTGVAIVRTWAESGGAEPSAEILHVAQVGSALLVTSTYADYDPEDPEQAVAAQGADLSPVLEQMCVFTAEGCAGS